jgi:sugar lactone lactonase YvrE
MQRRVADVALAAAAELGESPLWDRRIDRLLWVDIPPGHLHRLDPVSGRDELVAIGHSLSAVCLALTGYVIAIREGIATLADDGQWQLLAAINEDGSDLRMNDAACDPQGRLWAGSLHTESLAGRGALYRVDHDGGHTTTLTGVTISNGLDWSLDGRTMFYVDSATAGIDAFDFDAESGTISRRRRLIAIERGAGLPDGLTVDEDGCLWVALWEGGEVRRYDTAGQHLESVDVPASRVTSCAFGGAGLDELYITTARGQETEQYGGAVFCVQPGVRGRPAHSFGGQP